MAKREPDPEPVKEEQLESDILTAGERLRIAREKEGLTLEDVAAQTRIPRRHLESIEKAEWDSLPAPTYTIGFAKSYAGAVGLDRVEIGNQLREEMGGQRFASAATDVFEPADPRRTMPKGIVIGAVAIVVLLIAVMTWLNKRSLDQPDPISSAPTQSEAPAAGPSKASKVAPVAANVKGPVVLSATGPVWLQVSEKGGRILYSGTLQPSQTYTVPATASAPVLKTGKPEALKVAVGAATAPPVGRAATTVANVSLLPSDLMKAAGPVDNGSSAQAGSSRNASASSTSANAAK